ncbi:MAG: LapA family protein [Deltaproteobacteria bacterium]|nr:LapA family protein [Deltaproteobacteria bacterium]
MRLVKIILIILIFFLTVTFSLQNAEEVTIHYYGLIDPFTVPLFTVVLVTVLLGIIIGAVGGLLTNVKLRLELKRLKKKIDKAKRGQEMLKGEAFPKLEFPPSLTIKE